MWVNEENGKENQGNCIEASKIRIERKTPQNGYGRISETLTPFNSSTLHQRTLMTRSSFVRIIVERITGMQFALGLSQWWHGNLEHANGRGNEADVSNLRFFLVRKEATTLYMCEWGELKELIFLAEGEQIERKMHATEWLFQDQWMFIWNYQTGSPGVQTCATV